MFGRRNDDEDPFAALEKGATYQSSPTALPDIGLGSGADAPSTAVHAPSANVPSTAAVTARPSTPKPSSPNLSTLLGSWPAPRRRGPSGIGAKTILRIAIIVIVLFVALVPLRNAVNTIHSIKIPAFNFDSGFGLRSPTRPIGSAPKHPVFYLSASGARAGLAHLRRIVPGARLTLLRLDATTLSATAILPGGATKEVYFSPATRFVTPLPSAPGGQQPVSLSQVKPDAIGRIVTQMRRRYHVAPKRIDYVVLSSPAGLQPHWIVFVKSASHQGYWATLSGGQLRRLGT